MTVFEPREVQYYMERGECVVVIGPELLPIDGVPLYTYFLQQMSKEARKVKFLYEKDGFLVFQDAKKRNMLGFEVDAIRESLKPDLTTLKKLALLPIPFVLSINPDKFLETILIERGYNAKTYFARGSGHGGVQKMDKPTIKEPVIYNLFGSFDDPNSLILNYDDIFNFIGASFQTQDSIFPDVVQEILQKAQMFLFIGFELNRWYTQLLLRRLADENKLKYVINDTTKMDATTKQFLTDGFEVAFLDPQQSDFLDTLIDHFDKKGGFLRQPLQKEELSKAFTQSQLDKVRQFVEENQIQECLDFLAILAGDDAEDKDTVTLLKSQYKGLTDAQGKGTIDNNAAQLTLNQLKDRILKLSPSIYDKTGTL